MRSNRMKILLALTIAGLFVYGTAHAQTWYSGGYLEIVGILVHNTSLEIKLQGNSGCDRIFRVYSGDRNYDVKASALLSAYYAGHEVSVNYSGSLAACNTRLLRFKVRR